MELLGKPAINPWLFYTGKISGYIVWAGFVYSLCYDDLITGIDFYGRDIIAYGMFVLGLVISMVSLLYLGRSVRFGLPTEKTVLKTKGLYRYSRNPIYVGFGFLTIASMLQTRNIFIIILGVFSLVVYHLIILSEESFLLTRFGKNYERYMQNVRRYI